MIVNILQNSFLLVCAWIVLFASIFALIAYECDRGRGGASSGCSVSSDTDPMGATDANTGLQVQPSDGTSGSSDGTSDTIQEIW